MKIHSLTFLMMLYTFSAIAQHVGVGVDTPNAVLHIIDTSSTDPSLKIEAINRVDLDLHSPYFTGKSIRFFEDGEYRSSIFASGSVLSIFTDYQSTLANAALKITNTNKVGINFGPFGTPSQTLDVNGKIKIGNDLSTPTAGTMRYNSTSQKIEFHNGSSWQTPGSVWSLANNVAYYSDGSVFVGRDEPITGAEQFGIRRNVASAAYGGMYMETFGHPGGMPFYGYAVDDTARMWHFYDGGDQAWKINNGGVKFSLKKDGKTGIGIENPQTRLDVLGGIWNVDATEGDFRVGTPFYRLAIGVATAGAGAGITRIYSKGGQAKLILGSDDTDVLTIDSDNQVGIGTNSPVSDLHIYDESGLAELRLESDGGNANIRLDARTGNTSYSQIRFTESNILSGAVWYNYSKDALELYEGGTAMTIQNARIGIGTDPNINYKLSVNGKVICEELKVQLSENWPDYVFEEGYPLMTTEEISRFIDENGHLPGVPSASQVIQDEGIEVGEMNKILLEKIEELTLLLIDQQRQINSLTQLIEDK